MIPLREWDLSGRGQRCCQTFLKKYHLTPKVNSVGVEKPKELLKCSNQLTSWHHSFLFLKCSTIVWDINIKHKNESKMSQYFLLSRRFTFSCLCLNWSPSWPVNFLRLPANASSEMSS